MKQIASLTILVLVVFAFEVLKRVSTALPLTTSAFLKYFLENIQILVLLVMTTYAILLLKHFIFKSKLPTAKNILFIVVPLLTIIELSITFLLNSPNYIPNYLLKTFRYYYENFDVDKIQFNSKCAQYDPDLTYTLRPNVEYNFESREFHNTIKTNSIGTRGAAGPFSNSQIVFLGDSYTMGWGVEETNSFPSIVAKTANMSFLNSGVPSYGTVRECRTFDRLEFSQLKAIVIQYHKNDAIENQVYKLNRSKLRVRSELSYDSIVTSLRQRRIYYPFKHVLTMISILAKSKITESENYFQLEDSILPFEQAVNFLQIIKESKLTNYGVPIFVFDISGTPSSKSPFISNLDKILTTNPNIKDIITIDVCGELQQTDYFKLDTHLNEVGHEKVANLILTKLRSRKNN